MINYHSFQIFAGCQSRFSSPANTFVNNRPDDNKILANPQAVGVFAIRPIPLGVQPIMHPLDFVTVGGLRIPRQCHFDHDMTLMNVYQAHDTVLRNAAAAPLHFFTIRNFTEQSDQILVRLPFLAHTFEHRLRIIILDAAVYFIFLKQREERFPS